MDFVLSLPAHISVSQSVALTLKKKMQIIHEDDTCSRVKRGGGHTYASCYALSKKETNLQSFIPFRYTLVLWMFERYQP